MSRLLKVLLLLLVLLVGTAIGSQLKSIVGLHYGAKAVLTIDFSEQPKGFSQGDYYILKVLKIRGTKVDFGFSRLEVEEMTDIHLIEGD